MAAFPTCASCDDTGPLKWPIQRRSGVDLREGAATVPNLDFRKCHLRICHVELPLAFPSPLVDSNLQEGGLAPVLGLVVERCAHAMPIDDLLKNTNSAAAEPEPTKK
jgi:hypothetical protein